MDLLGNSGRRPPAFLFLFGVAALVGCSAPFDHGAADLVDFRIVAISVDSAAVAPGEALQARALVYGGEGFFHDTAPTLSWSLGEATSQEPLALLTAPDTPGDWELGLEVTASTGASERAVLRIEVADDAQAVEPPESLTVSLSQVDGVSVADLTVLSEEELGTALALEQRWEWTSTEADFLSAAQVARLSVDLDDPTERFSTHWRVSDGAGDFLELSHTEAHWFPFDVALDDEGAAEWAVDVETGHFGAVAVVLDGEGASTWAFRDVVVLDAEGDSAFVGVAHDGRWVGTDVALGADVTTIAATLEASDSPSGIQFVDVEESGSLGSSDPTGVGALACPGALPDGASFRLDWLAEGWCGRDDVLGARVIVEVSGGAGR